MKKPINLFLDIDGVITTPKQWNLSMKAKTRLHQYESVYPFDPLCVKILNEILDAYDFKIIVHSDWVYHFNLNEMQDIFEINGVSKTPLDTTGYGFSMDRFKDRLLRIENYVKENGATPGLVLDDMNIMNPIVRNSFFHIENGDEGLKKTGVKEKILNFLEKKYGKPL